MFWKGSGRENLKHTIFITFHDSDMMGRLKEIVADTTKIVSKTDSIIKISLKNK